MPAGSPWHRLVLEGGGDYLSSGHFDSEASLVAVRPLHGYPLVVNVAVSESWVLATWRIQAITIGIGTLLVMFCSAFFIKAMRKQFHRLTISEATLGKKAHELERAN